VWVGACVALSVLWRRACGWAKVLQRVRNLVGGIRKIADVHHLGAPSPTTSVSERRLVSVLFADLVGFTSLSENRDPEEIRGLLSTISTAAGP